MQVSSPPPAPCVHAPHAAQLLMRLREQQHQALLRSEYKTFGADHRVAAKHLYACKLFAPAHACHYNLYACLACDACHWLSMADHHNVAMDLLKQLSIWHHVPPCRVARQCACLCQGGARTRATQHAYPILVHSKSPSTVQ